MEREILVGGEGQDLRVAVREDGRLVEYYEQATEAQRAAGNIYKGRVENVLPGMQAAFVNIGLDRNAYLYVADAYPVPFEEEEEPELKQLVRRRRRSIGELLRPGQEIIVQVAKEPVGTKGARVTRTVTLPGRYLVLVPGGDQVAVSQRVEDEGERARLRDLARELRPRGAGLIVRTAAEGRSRADLEADVALLRRLWLSIRQRAGRAPAPALLHSDQDVLYRVLRDLLSPQVTAVRVEAVREHARARELMRLFAPELEGRLHLEPPGGPPLLEAQGVDEELQKALERRVWLPSGAHVVIDQAEALTAIDVNTGRFVGSTNLHDTTLAVNLEAAREIARLIRLRDIGGMIVIDFIDLSREAQRGQVVRELEEHLRRDRTRAAVLGVTNLGLVEVTRRKRRQSLTELLTRPCPTCGGSGRVAAEVSAGRQARRQLRRLALETESEALLVEAHPSLAAVLIGPGGANLRDTEKETGKAIFVRGAENCPPGELRLVARGSRKEVEARALPVQVGQVLELKVEEPHVTHARDGIARVEGYVIDIEGAGAQVGQKVRVEITKAFRTYAKARIVV